MSERLWLGWKRWGALGLGRNGEIYYCVHGRHGAAKFEGVDAIWRGVARRPKSKGL